MFGTSGIRGQVGSAVTADLALSVGRALASEGVDRVVVGRDVRDSGEMLVDAIAAGCMECGTDVDDVGVAATPTIARAVGWQDADAGVVVTGSHNPPTDNGIKCWTPSGQAYEPAELRRIEDRIRADRYDFARWDETGTRRTVPDVDRRHVSAVRAAVEVRKPLTVIVDLGNGAGSVTATALAELGCRVVTLNGHRDGSFPGRPSEPTAETLGDLERVVEATGADLGVAHDGDADRLMAVDDTGTFVPKDVLLALFATSVAGQGDAIATPVDTSLAVEDALAAVGATVVRTRVGDGYVAARTADPTVVFGGEPSGAWIWPEQTRCPDGPLAAAKLVELVAQRGSLAELVAGIERYPIRRISVEVADPGAVMERVRAQVTDQYDEVDTRDGVRVDTENGWFLLRASGTEPLVRVTAEARTEGQLADRFEEATGLLATTRE